MSEPPKMVSHPSRQQFFRPGKKDFKVDQKINILVRKIKKLDQNNRTIDLTSRRVGAGPVIVRDLHPRGHNSNYGWKIELRLRSIIILTPTKLQKMSQRWRPLAEVSSFYAPAENDCNPEYQFRAMEPLPCGRLYSLTIRRIWTHSSSHRSCLTVFLSHLT